MKFKEIKNYSENFMYVCEKLSVTTLKFLSRSILNQIACLMSYEVKKQTFSLFICDKILPYLMQ